MQRATICLVCRDYWREYVHLCVIDGMAVAFPPHVLIAFNSSSRYGKGSL